MKENEQWSLVTPLSSQGGILMIELNEYRSKKDGKVTPKALSNDLVEWVESGDVETLVYVIKTKKGDIHTARSNGFGSEHIGLMEIGKMQILESMRE